VELIPVSIDTGAQVPIVSPDGLSTLPWMRRFAVRHGWTEQPSSYGVPQWTLPDGGLVSYEPGGQIELSAAAFPTATGLLRSLRGTVLPLAAFLRDAGIALLSVGVEPRNGLEDVDLQLPGARYVRLTDFLRDAGTGGERMMRQTAAVQVSVDFGAEPLRAWRVLNAMAPYVTAIFASSPVYRGEPTGHRSYRARIWRELDGGRTGCFRCADPVAEYLDFALAAPSILLGDGARWRPFAEWSAEGCAGPDEWRAHLTTLFPEIRPKGFAEVRSADAVAPEWYAAPLVLLAGILYHAPTLRAADDRLGAPDPALLHAAAAGDLARLAMHGAAALPGFFAADDLDEAAAFFARYTLRARSPADDVLDALPSPEPAGCQAAD
jgi:glutamate--cysteine ligase